MMEIPSSFLRLLVDDGGCLSRLFALFSTKEEAVGLLAYLARHPVLVSTNGSVAYATNDLAPMFSFYLEALEGADLEARYRWMPETPGRYGEELMATAQCLNPEFVWEERLGALGIQTMTFERYKELHGSAPPFAQCGLDIDNPDF